MATSHHGDPASGGPQNEIMKRFLAQLEGTARREYPHGRMGADDEGALSYAVAADREHGTVVIRFGKPVEWIGLHPADVAALVKVLVKRAREISTEPFAVEL